MKQSLKKRIGRMLLYGIGAYVLVCICAFAIQRSLLYFPSNHDRHTSLAAWKVDGQTIGYCHQVASPQVVWLMTHGNAGQAADRDYVLDRMASNSSLYVLEYPGYGARDASPSKSTFDAAAIAAYDSLRNRFPNTPVCVIGESIGSGPASVLANSQPAPEKIILITPFDSLVRVASRRFFALPVGLLLLDRWDNVKALENYDGELQIYGAKDDQVIPVSHAQRLSELCPNAEFQLIEGGHNDWSFNSKVRIEF